MSKSSSNKPNKSSKVSKASSKSKPNIEIHCKFRGKYDLNKKKNNKEINLENAINLFEVIYKKNENLFRDTTIKMFKDKKLFSFGDKKGLSKVHHRVPYLQVNKFFVLHRDPTMVIMGVNHKSYKWFLVFQFNNVEDLSKFCDEIEGEKKIKNDVKEVTLSTDDSPAMSIDIPQIKLESEDTVDNQYRNVNDVEKISIHSEMINTREMAFVNFEDSYYEPDLNTQMTPEHGAISAGSSRPSSRSSNDSEFDNRVHCDGISQPRLKDLYMKPGSTIYLDNSDWEEDITCLNYSINKDVLQDDKTGSIYMYCAQFKSKSFNELSDDSFSLSSGDENQFHDYKPKLVKKIDQDIEVFNHFQPKLLEENFTNYNHHESKLATNDLYMNNNLKSQSKKDVDLENLDHYHPKLVVEN